MGFNSGFKGLTALFAKYSGDQTKNNELGGSCDMYGGGKVHTGFWWGNKGKKPFGRPRYRWKDSIEMDLQEVAWTGLIWLRMGTGGGLL